MRRLGVAFVFLLVSLARGAQNTANPAEAASFLEKAEAELLLLGSEAGRADWVKSTHITDDTEALAAAANQRVIDATVRLAKQAARFDGVKLPPDMARKMKLLKLSLTVAAPSDPKLSAELTRIPQTEVTLEGKSAETMLKLYYGLEEHDDVQHVYANFDIADEIMENFQG